VKKESRWSESFKFQIIQLRYLKNNQVGGALDSVTE